MAVGVSETESDGEGEGEGMSTPFSSNSAPGGRGTGRTSPPPSMLFTALWNTRAPPSMKTITAATMPKRCPRLFSTLPPT